MKTNYIGNHGVCYGITPNGEYFSYNPEKNGSYYHDTEEEARLSAIKINKMLDKKEMDSIKDFERINAMESTQKKNTVKLNEAQLKKIVAESVKRVLKEDDRAEIANTLGKMREAWKKIVEASNFLYPLIEEAENNPDMKYGERLLKFDKLVNMMKDTLIIGSPSPSGYFADNGA